ncbi:hypothetical protein ACO2Q8_01890 [Larkinella sp. VNQ87]|uniref:hypothetical protein n=1 Tax=Larkinella sp. VNQ87 TaxID=3400921 RepID=UPI003BFAD469
MRKSTAAPLAVLCCLFAASCHRPYARYQPIPLESFHSTRKAKPVVPVSDSTATAPEDWASWVVPKSGPIITETYASAATVPPLRSPQQRVGQAATATRVHQPIRETEAQSFPQPRPKPKAKNNEKKTLREILGLKPRKKLNWWQRIPWQLKASIPVIGVALVFAILGINVLAIIFGILGAFLLIRGLKRSFKVRRPLF